MAIELVDNAGDDADTIAEGWNVYNATVTALLTQHTSAGAHKTTGDIVLKTLFDANTILAANADNTPAALAIAASRILGRAASGNIAALTTAQVRTLINVENGADVTDATNVNTAGAVMEEDYNANTILAANNNNTPAALTIAEQSLIGRITSGNITALTAAQGRTLLDVIQDTADVIKDSHIDWGQEATQISVGRTASYTVAANDSTAEAKAQADYLCDGTADNVQIQAAIDAANTAGKGSVVLVAGAYSVDAQTELKANVFLTLELGATIVPSTSFDIIKIKSDALGIGYIYFDVSGIDFTHACVLYDGSEFIAKTGLQKASIQELRVKGADHGGDVHGIAIKFLCEANSERVSCTHFGTIRAELIEYVVYNEMSNNTGTCWVNGNIFDRIIAYNVKYLWYGAISGGGTHNVKGNQFLGLQYQKSDYTTSYVIDMNATYAEHNVFEGVIWDLGAGEEAFDLPAKNNCIRVRCPTGKEGNWQGTFINPYLATHGVKFHDLDVADGAVYADSSGLTLGAHGYIGATGVSIADDAVHSFDAERTRGTFLIYGVGTGAKHMWGMINYRVSATHYTSKCWGWAQLTASTGVKTGTTGADGDLTVSVDSGTGKFYIENRTGATSIFGWVHLG